MLPLLVSAGATLDPTRTYRYVLWRNFMPEPRSACLWIMLNPSTADERANDPTIRRCCNFTQDWGFESCRVVNLFAFRSPSPGVLHKVADPIGPENDAYITLEASSATKIVCAWGINGTLGLRSTHVQKMLSGYTCWCFGLSKNGEPQHPLYQHSRARLVPWH